MKKTIDEVFANLHDRTGDYTEEKFRADALDAAGLTGHPKADRAYEIAWQYGNAYGYHDIFCVLLDIAPLLTED